MREAQRIRRRLVDDYPGVTEFRKRLADSHLDRGFLMFTRRGQRKPRPSIARRWRSTRGWLTTIRPSRSFAVPWRAATRTSQSTLAQTGKPAEAEAEYRQAMALYQKLADDDPAVYGVSSGSGTST